MKNVSIVITSKVLHIDKVYPRKKYDKIWVQVAPIMDELNNQIYIIVHYNIIANSLPNIKKQIKL